MIQMDGKRNCVDYEALWGADSLRLGNDSAAPIITVRKIELVSDEAINNVLDRSEDDGMNIHFSTSQSNVHLKIYLITQILRSGCLAKIAKPNSVIKITFDIENGSGNVVDVLQQVSDSAFFSYEYEYIVVDSDKGVETSYCFLNLVSAVSGDSSHLCIDFITDRGNLEAKLRKVLEVEKAKYYRFKEYLTAHPLGFPYLVGWIDDDYSAQKWAEGDVCCAPRVIEAWTPDQAIQTFLDREKMYDLNEYFKKLFVYDLAESFFFGETDSLNLNATATSFLETIALKVGDEPQLSSEAFAKAVAEMVSPREMLKIVGVDCLQTLWRESRQIDVYAVLDSDVQDLIRSVGPCTQLI